MARRCPVCTAEGVSRHTEMTDRLFDSPGKWNMLQCRTPDCGTLWLDPAPTEQDLAQAYSRYHTHGDGANRDRAKPPSELRRLDERVRRAYLHRFYGYPFDGPSWFWVLSFLLPWRWRYYAPNIMYLPFRSGGRLLDVGAGSGLFMARMRDLGWNVDGVEVDDQARHAATARYGLTLRAGTIERQEFPDATFDAVVLKHVIEHVPDPVSVLRECHRVLKPGGLLSITTPNALSLGARLFGSNWRGLEPPRHLQIFSVASLERAARAAGFEGISSGSTAHDAYIWGASYALSRNRPFDNGAPRLTRFERIASELALLVPSLMLSLNPHAGEEVVLTCQRTR